MFWRTKALLLKPEVTYGTDVVPAAADAIEARDVNLTPLEAQAVEPEPVAPHMGAGPTWLVGKQVKLDFAIQVAGSGAAGTPPAYGTVIRACGMAEVVTALTDVVYLPVSDGFESASIYLTIDKVLHKIVGARGSMRFEIAANGIPMWKFSFVGLFTKPIAGVLPAVSFAAFKDPVPPSKVNTPTVQVHGYNAILVSANFALNTNPALVPRVNSERVQISDRSATAELVIEEPEIGDKDFWAAVESHTRDAVRLVHGTVAGNIVEIDAPKGQITRIGKGQSEGIITLTLTMSLKPDAGDDDLQFTIK